MEAPQSPLTRVQAAQIQLERAIVLYLEEKDFVSAITLAGAAEEILGKAIAAARGEPVVESSAAAISGFSVALGGDPVEKKDAISLMNYARDSLKHFGDGSSVDCDFEEEAFELIDRAVSNFWGLTQQQTPSMTRFLIAKRGTGI